MKVPLQTSAVIRRFGYLSACTFSSDGVLLLHKPHSDLPFSNFPPCAAGKHWCYCQDVNAYECCDNAKGCRNNGGICTCNP